MPGTRFRLGYDALIGLLPGVGDVAMGAVSAYILTEAARFGVRRRVLARMALNIGLEVLLGAVPLVGDLFDAAFKANLRNVALLETELGTTETPSHR